MSENFIPGEVVIDSITLVNQEGDVIDLKSICGQIDIFESINEGFLTGRLSIADGLGIFRRYKILGQEHITIRYRAKLQHEFESGDFSVEKVFRVYKVSNMRAPEFHTYGYVLHIIEPKYLTCIRKRLSKVMRGSYSEILLQTLLKDAQFEKLPKNNRIDYWEETLPENQQLICPNWSIAKLIDYIVENANKGEDAVYKNSMFFYQTLIGGFKFMSLNQMVSGENDHVVEFDFLPRNFDIDQENRGSNEPLGGQSTRILHFEIVQRGDTVRGISAGAYSSMLKTYDPIRKLEKEIVFDLGENFKKKGKKHLSGFPLLRLDEDEVVHMGVIPLTDDEDYTYNEIGAELALNKSIDDRTFYRVNPTNAFSDKQALQDTSQYVGNEQMDSGMLERNSMSIALSSHTYKVTIPARTDMTSGMVVNLKLPGGVIDKNDEDILNDDRYLITHIHHVINPQQARGTMVMNVVKESFAEDIRKVDPLKDYEGFKQDD